MRTPFSTIRVSVALCKYVDNRRYLERYCSKFITLFAIYFFVRICYTYYLRKNKSYFRLLTCLSLHVDIKSKDKSMFTQKQLSFLEKSNYQTIRITDDYCEFRSHSTWHCWVIKKEPACLRLKYPYTIYHKHKTSDYYHRHWQTKNFENCIISIENHDNYVLRTEKLMRNYNHKR